MRRLFGITLFLVIVPGVFNGQQAALSTPPQAANPNSERVKVYSPGPDVTTPELIPIEMPVTTEKECKNERKGEVTLSVVVDAQGRSHNVSTLQWSESDLNQLAILVIRADQFKPGIYEKNPVAIGQSVEVSMDGCMVKTKDDQGKKTTRLVLKTQPVQKFSNLQDPITEAIFSADGSVEMHSTIAFQGIAHIRGKISAPKYLNSVEAEYSKEARKAKIQGSCWISVIIDEQGKPQNARIMKSLDPGLDQNAIDAVNKYRFKPAMKDGQPVPVMITVEINFKLYY